MNVNIVLSVKGRKVTFDPHEDCFKWKIMLPIERIEFICEKSHYFECVVYEPRIYHEKIYVEAISDKWGVPVYNTVVLPMRNGIIDTNQIAKALFSNCHFIIDIHTLKLNIYKILGGNKK